MDEHEAAAIEAESKAVALYSLSWEAGTGAIVWVRAVQDVLALHETARDQYAAKTVDLEAFLRLHATALMLVVAIDQVLIFERRIRQLTGDAELARARKRFDTVCPDAEALRDLVAHQDDYALEKGRRQTGKPNYPPLKEPYLDTFIRWGNGGGTILDLAGESINLRAAASAANDLAELAERVRAKHLHRVEREANAARRRQYGLPPE
jgi:hypothetical protein